MNTHDMNLNFEVKRLKQKCNYGAELVDVLRKKIRFSVFEDKTERDKLEAFADSINMFMQEL